MADGSGNVGPAHQMQLDPLLGEDDDNPLAMYLNPTTIGAYSEKDLSASFSGLQNKLRSLGLPLCGDIFRNDVENLKSTIRW